MLRAAFGIADTGRNEAHLLDVRAVIPVHYGTFPILAGTPDELRAELRRVGAGNVAVIAPERGVATPLP